MTSVKVTQLVTERGVIIYLLREVNIALQYHSQMHLESMELFTPNDLVLKKHIELDLFVFEKEFRYLIDKFVIVCVCVCKITSLNIA